jgi:YfiH family protein
MLRKKRGSLEWLEFELFQQFPKLFNAVFLRHGGHSVAPYHFLNLSISKCSDDPYIQKNKALVLPVTQADEWVEADAIHGANIVSHPVSSEISGYDGVVTGKKKVALVVTHADCQAAIFYDPIREVIGNAHSGWKGNVANIYHEMVKHMVHVQGCRAEDIHVAISPSLGPCCAQFIHYQKEFPESFWEFQVKPLYFNLWQIARKQLRDTGILDSHIQIAEICTFCHASDFFSYRRDRVTGRNATVACLH